MTPDDELQEAKNLLKQAMLSGDKTALAKAEAEIIRIRNFQIEKERTFLHDSGMLVAWGEPEGDLH